MSINYYYVSNTYNGFLASNIDYHGIAKNYVGVKKLMLLPENQDIAAIYANARVSVRLSLPAPILVAPIAVEELLEAPEDALTFASKAEQEQLHLARCILDATACKSALRSVEASFVRPAKRARVDEEGEGEEEEEYDEEEQYDEEDGSSVAGSSAPSVNGLLSAMEL